MKSLRKQKANKSGSYEVTKTKRRLYRLLDSTESLVMLQHITHTADFADKKSFIVTFKHG